MIPSLQEKSCTHSSGISLVNILAKKTSQLITTLTAPKKKGAQSEESVAAASLARMEITASVMVAAKSLISWLDRTPSALDGDYPGFRQDVLKFSMDLSSILVSSYPSRTTTLSLRVTIDVFFILLFIWTCTV